ncbi:PspA/IM30 family protein [Gorillibacterium sp. CAU 1737]|uniref:PspA/IM30 family protein n=1 Tax=Gorillibacterium sp. CAU 1737 TaxID=3140362 RepID=UPI0032604F16
MGILSRFTEIMKANIGDLGKRGDDLEARIDEYMRRLNQDLGSVKAETAAVMAAENRAKRALDECTAEIRKLERYAEKSVADGEDDAALRFLEKKEKQVGLWNDLQTAHEEASSNAGKMKQLLDKLTEDIRELTERQTAWKAQAGSDGTAKLGTLRDQTSLALDEALALAELRGNGERDRLERELAELDRDPAERQAAAQRMSANPRDELEALKAKLNKPTE